MHACERFTQDIVTRLDLQRKTNFSHMYITRRFKYSYSDGYGFQ